MRSTATGTRLSRPAARALIIGVLLGGVLAASCSSAGALTLVNGPVTLSTPTPLAAGDALKDDQTITITVAANSTLSRSSLAAAGFPSGVASMKVLECDDPGGTKANLPTTEAYHCDGETIMSTALVNQDGSFKMAGYTVYALPDATTFGEAPDSKPTCGTLANQCVLYLGPNQLDFSKPHLFSAPFLVSSAGGGSALGANPTGSASSGQPIASATGAGSLASGTLAYTGTPASWPWLVGAGALLVAVGALARRRLRLRRFASL